MTKANHYFNCETNVVQNEPIQSPSRSGCRWNASEEEFVLNCVNDGTSFENIASELGRSVRAVRYRIFMIGYDMVYKQNKDVDYVVELLHLDKPSFLRWIERQSFETKRRELTLWDVYKMLWEMREDLIKSRSIPVNQYQ